MTRLTDPLKLDTSRGFPTYLRTADDALVAEIGEKEMARRIHAALNALAGVSTEMLEILEVGGLNRIAEATFDERRESNRIEQQRDELMAALSELLSTSAPEWETESGITEYATACSNARAAIKRAEASK